MNKEETADKEQLDVQVPAERGPELKNYDDDTEFDLREKATEKQVEAVELHTEDSAVDTSQTGNNSNAEDMSVQNLTDSFSKEQEDLDSINIDDSASIKSIKDPDSSMYEGDNTTEMSINKDNDDDSFSTTHNESKEMIHEPSPDSEAQNISPAIQILNANTDEDEKIKSFPTLPEEPPKPENKRRVRRHSPSMALSMSAITANGEHTVAAIVFVKNALQSIEAHKAVRKDNEIKSAVANALGM